MTPVSIRARTSAGEKMFSKNLHSVGAIEKWRTSDGFSASWVIIWLLR